MNASEAALLLGMCASFDRRTVGEADSRAWALVLADVTLDDAQRAVAAHYGESREWIMPADVKRLVKAMRRDRLERNITGAPVPELTDDPVRYRAALAANIKSIADARSLNRTLGNPRRNRPLAIAPAPDREPQAPRALAAKVDAAREVLRNLEDFGAGFMAQARSELGDVDSSALVVRAAELARGDRPS